MNLLNEREAIESIILAYRDRVKNLIGKYDISKFPVDNRIASLNEKTATLEDLRTAGYLLSIPTCDECEQERWNCVEFGPKFDNYHKVTLCADCLRKAWELTQRESLALSHNLPIIPCVHCDKPAVRIDHFYPYHQEYNSCKEHLCLTKNG